MILHWCEACDREETLDPQDAYELGWDFPPKMGSLGIVSPRTCPYCYIDKTAWFAAMTNKPLTERHLKTIERIKEETK